MKSSVKPKKLKLKKRLRKKQSLSLLPVTETTCQARNRINLLAKSADKADNGGKA
jgi:hypothetical protein